MKIPSLAIIAAAVIAASTSTSAGAISVPQNTEDKSQQIVALTPAFHQGGADLTSAHASHSSHASHASHSSHFSGR